MEPYCCRESLKSHRPECFIHYLPAVLNMCTMDEVCKAQAYILFYTQRLTENGHSKPLSGSQHPKEEIDTSSNEILS
eukprot:bmy_13228T0